MRAGRVFAVMFAVVLMAGCIEGDGDDMGSTEGDSEPLPDPVVDFDPGWPEIEDAVVRPGVSVRSERGGCTSNFVFQSPDNMTLYLGLAAHCLMNEGPGENVTIAGEVDAKVAYDSWYTMEEMDGDAGVSRSQNDFAVIEIPDEARHLVHPAMVHYGGPVGVAERGEEGEKVFTYGTSGYRQGIGPLNNREGYVYQSSDWYTSMHMITPGVWGDSGSAVLNSKGEALGVLIHLGPAPATNGATNLHAALEFAYGHEGFKVEVSTWRMLDWGLLPALPLQSLTPPV